LHISQLVILLLKNHRMSYGTLRSTDTHTHTHTHTHTRARTHTHTHTHTPTHTRTHTHTHTNTHKHTAGLVCVCDLVQSCETHRWPQAGSSSAPCGRSVGSV